MLTSELRKTLKNILLSLLHVNKFLLYCYNILYYIVVNSSTYLFVYVRKRCIIWLFPLIKIIEWYYIFTLAFYFWKLCFVILSHSSCSLGVLCYFSTKNMHNVTMQCTIHSHMMLLCELFDCKKSISSQSLLNYLDS